MSVNSSSDDEFDLDEVFEILAGPQWADVKPIPQNDIPNPVVNIRYSVTFRRIMDYFRAIVALDEKSTRAKWLTEAAVRVNPANFSAWYYRRLCLWALNSDLEKELQFTTDLAGTNPKNYQLWHHRREIMEQICRTTSQFEKIQMFISDELQYTQHVFIYDAKNYHAWAYRQFLLMLIIKQHTSDTLPEYYSSLWDTELKFVNRLLQEDIRNNSAWTHRYFTITQAGMRQINPTIANEEIQFVLQSFSKVLHNEAAWNYLQAMLMEQYFNPELQDTMAQLIQITTSEAAQTCLYAMEFHAEYLLAKNTKEDTSKAKQILHQLQTSVDPIRHNYWQYRIELLEETSL